MTKKRSYSTSMHLAHILILASKLMITLCLLLFLLVFIGLHSHDHSSSFTSRTRIRPFSDTNGFHIHDGRAKIAFLFLVRKNLPLDFLWHTFFKNGNTASFSIYIHSEPEFVFNESTTRSSFFYDRQLNNSVQVAWGGSSMIEAERLLFDEALDDPANQRFVLLSDSCVPLYNFSYTYSYLISSPKSFVDSFLDVKDRRYNPDMSPTIPKEKWRKGSQWITLVRRHAEIIVDDNIIFPLFKKFCKRRPPVNFNIRSKTFMSDFKFDAIEMLKFHRNCIPDEHYVQTLLAMRGLENKLERRTLTYSMWNQSGIRRSWHPITFNYSDANPHQIKEIKDINHVGYESEHRTEWCRSNFRYTRCFLFARKFTSEAAARLLKDGLVGPI